MGTSTIYMIRDLLPDTNAAIAVIKGNDRIEALLSDAQLYTSIIVIGELYYGASYSERRSENLENILTFMSSVKVLSCGEETAVRFGEIKADLRKKGRMIPDNDIWIAATSLQHGLELVTRDGHFQHVDN